MTQNTRQAPSHLVKWFWYLAVFAAAVAATAYVTQSHPASKTVLSIVGTTYTAYTAVNFAMTISTVFKTPNLRHCLKHWRYKMSSSIRGTCRIATIICPTLPYWATAVVSVGAPDLTNSIIATAVFTAGCSVVINHYQIKEMLRQFDLHQNDGCPNNIAEPSVLVIANTDRPHC